VQGVKNKELGRTGAKLHVTKVRKIETEGMGDREGPRDEGGV
jgi:hypothetical protein